jgi:nucleotide-binding universal stress UspA family protein
MKQILVVTTADGDATGLVGPVAQLAEETGAAVTVLVVDDVESQRFATLPREELLREAGEGADRLVAQLAAAGVEATPIARSGAAADAAIELAEQIDADLLVVESSPRRGVVERLLGSLALDLINRSGRQVLVVAS